MNWRELWRVLAAGDDEEFKLKELVNVFDLRYFTHKTFPHPPLLLAWSVFKLLTDFPVRYEDMMMLESSPPLICAKQKKGAKSWINDEPPQRSLRRDTHNQSIVERTRNTHDGSNVEPFLTEKACKLIKVYGHIERVFNSYFISRT